MNIEKTIFIFCPEVTNLLLKAEQYITHRKYWLLIGNYIEYCTTGRRININFCGKHIQCVNNIHYLLLVNLLHIISTETLIISTDTLIINTDTLIIGTDTIFISTDIIQ